MPLEVKVPAVGESVQEAMIHRWHKEDGEYVQLDDVLLELETDKATVEVTAEASGVLKRTKAEGDTVAIGDVIAQIDTEAEKPQSASPETDVAPQSTPPQASPVIPKPPAAAPQTSHKLSPAVSRMVAEHNIKPDQIAATGKGGRITKTDVVTHINLRQDQPQSPQSALGLAIVPQENVAKSADSAPTQPAQVGERGERRVPMSMLRRRIAERLVHAQQTAAILTTFNEIDLQNYMNLRVQYKDSFKERYGVGLGFMSVFVKATVEALKAFPAINGWIEGNDIVYHDYYDIGVAVSSDKGLVVPVIKNIDRMSFADIELAIANYAKKAREGKITIDDMSGGTFTISNGGVFGSLISTPILNPPQSAILGMHKIQQRPIVENGEVCVRPMMYVAVSYDHRIVDGKEAVQFLVKIKDCVEDPHRLLLGV
jgi:2-oxoglutarate dehydrogenase E2 component (dihydrolipoamide succinyltransferase)